MFLNNDFKDLLEILNTYKVEYLLIGGLDFETAWPNRVNKEIAPDLFVPVISLEDMIKNKTESARDKDLTDLKYLKKALEEDQNK